MTLKLWLPSTCQPSHSGRQLLLLVAITAQLEKGRNRSVRQLLLPPPLSGRREEGWGGLILLGGNATSMTTHREDRLLCNTRPFQVPGAQQRPSKCQPLPMALASSFGMMSLPISGQRDRTASLLHGAFCSGRRGCIAFSRSTSASPPAPAV